jgi:hypothetical protein
MLSFEHSLAGGSTCPERGVSSKISARLTGGNETIKSAVALATVVKPTEFCACTASVIDSFPGNSSTRRKIYSRTTNTEHFAWRTIAAALEPRR